MSWRDLVGRFNRKPSVPEFNSGEVLVGIPSMRPPSIQELVQRYVREAMSPAAEAEGMESFDEADDFEEEDPDVVPLTHHEVIAMDEDELRGHAAGYGLELHNGQVPQEGAAPPTPPTERRQVKTPVPTPDAPPPQS